VRPESRTRAASRPWTTEAPVSRLYLNAAPGIPLLGPSGASAHVRGIAQAWRPDRVITARAADRRGIHGHIDVAYQETGVPGWPSWLEPWRDIAEIRAARKVARAATWLRPTVVWERWSLFSDAGWKVREATGARWILEVNAPLLEERRRYEELRQPAWAERWQREVLLAGAEIVAVSAWLVDWLRALGAKSVRHVPNGVEPLVGDRDATRARLGIQDKLVIGFLGSMKPWHGVERLPALLDVFPDAVGLVVGEGPVKVEHPRIITVGQVPEAETAHLVAAMDIGLAPYAADAPPWFCPLKILAYRAQGTPVVATDIGDCRLLTGDAGTVGEDFADAVRHWAGRRTEPMVRSWADVVRETVG
jgi:alpha-maltose-1-phosphate synthase